MAFSPDEAFRLISQAQDQGRLAHAYLIHGTQGPDLRNLAARIIAHANAWPEPENLDEVQNRGAFIVEPESKLRRIKVDQMRELTRWLQVTNLANIKAGVIVDADRMMPEAANAFLRTLEEPPANSLLLLLTRQPEQLLDTIRSRCIRVPIFRKRSEAAPLTAEQEQLLEMLASHFAGTLNSSRALLLQRQFESLLGEIKDGIARQHSAALDEEKEEYGKTTEGNWLKTRDSYYDDLTESRYQEERSSLLALLIVWLGEILRIQVGAAEPELPSYRHVLSLAAQKMRPADLHRRLRYVEEMRRNLQTTIREPLALEVGFLNAFGA